MIEFEAEITKGIGVASGLNCGPAHEFHHGSIKLQRSAMEDDPYQSGQFGHIAKKYNDLEIYNGTLNLTFNRKMNFVKKKATYLIEDLQWTKDVTETFYIYEATLIFNKVEFPCFIYRPARSKIAAHTSEIVEVLAPKVPGIQYGDKVKLRFNEKILWRPSFLEKLKLKYYETTEEELIQDAA